MDATEAEHSSQDLGADLRGRSIMLVDDAVDDLKLLGAAFRRLLGTKILVAASAEEALRLLGAETVDLIVTDLTLPGANGLDLTRALHRRNPPIPVIVLTASDSIAHAVEALKLGARDYLQKPIEASRVIARVREVLGATEGGTSEKTEPLGPVFENMLGQSPAMNGVFARITKVAATEAPVLIVGESGTGKELVARALHNRSRRKHGPFVPVHTGAIPRELVASELFGHERGAFTGALTSVDGRFSAADRGTLFLDEVGTMDHPTQVSLLRVLETLRYTRVGGTRELKADVRIVAATNADLLERVERGTFREDLYYRLNVLTIALPPLRERPEDLRFMAERFLQAAAERYGVPPRGLSQSAVDKLLAYGWPGNVRELRNAMDQVAVLGSGDVISADELDLTGARLPRAHLAEPTELPIEEPAPFAC